MYNTRMPTACPSHAHRISAGAPPAKRETIAGQAREAAWEDGSNGGFRMVARRVLADGVAVVVCNNTSYDHQQLGLLAGALMEAAYA